MTDRPSEFPEWASAPPANTITSPTTVQRQEGWQPTKPRRQFSNWLHELAYRWFQWIDQITTRNSADVMNDHALPNGSPPTLGAGLSVLAGDFSGRVIVDGYPVGPIDSPPITYSANSDIYWDLGRTGIWYAATVVAFAPAPAVTPFATRVYAVRTNATDRITLILDNRRERTEIKTIGLGHGKDHDDPAVVFERQTQSGAQYSLMSEIRADGGSAPIFRTYVREDATRTMVMTVGARYEFGVGWTAEQNAPRRYEIGPGTMRSSVANSILDTNVFADAQWLDVGTDLLPESDLVLENRGGVRTGRELDGFFPHWEIDRSNSSQRYEEIMRDTASGVSVYVASFSVAGDQVLAVARNCRYREGVGWSRIAGAAFSTLTTFGNGGVRLYERSDLAASPWLDTEDPALGWTRGATNTRTAFFGASAFIPTSGGSAAISNLALTGNPEASLTAYFKGAGVEEALYADLGSIPEGAIITGATFYFSSYNDGAQFIRAALIRSVPGAAANVSLKAGGTPYDSLVGSGVNGTLACVIDETPVVRTVGGAGLSALVMLDDAATCGLVGCAIDYDLAEISRL